MADNSANDGATRYGAGPERNLSPRPVITNHKPAPAANPPQHAWYRPWEQVFRAPISRPERIEVRAPHAPKPPARAPLILVIGFLATILIGSVLLTLPAANRQGEVTPYLTALFTATSAVCVTGLVVVDTLTYWSPFGQAVILALIQLGGLGFMTSSTILFIFIGHRVTLRERLLLREAHGVSPIGGVLRLTRQVLLVTILIEGAGALVLFARFATQFPADWALWMGVFHSISAFNNAGFDLIGGFRSLTVFSGDPVILFTFGLLIVMGGISFTVIVDLWGNRRWRSLLVDTKLVLFTTMVLLAVGSLGILVLEASNGATLSPMDVPAKLFNAVFSAITPRTAGFSSIDVGQMTQAGLLLTIALMFIGAASGSTGGGIKINTFAVLTSAVISSIRGRGRTTAFGRELPQSYVTRALTVVLLALGVVFIVTLALSSIEPMPISQLLFEATSAFGTVGLSTGITPDLSPAGRLIIILTMFIGRLGPLTVALALVERSKPEVYRFPEGRVKIG